MKSMFYTVAVLVLAAFVAVAVWIRIAPSDAARWQVPVAEAAMPAPGPCLVANVPHGARTSCLIAGDPAAILTRLNATALATPRTTLLAGSPAEGRITWVTRSRLMAYPDYTTAEASQTPQGTRLDIFARQRFGESDFGVNALRLRSWLATL